MPGAEGVAGPQGDAGPLGEVGPLGEAGSQGEAGPQVSLGSKVIHVFVTVTGVTEFLFCIMPGRTRTDWSERAAWTRW